MTPSFDLVEDPTSARGALINSVTIVAGENFQFDFASLWQDGTLAGPALIEIVTDLSHEGRTIAATEILVSGNAVSWIQYYHSDGDLVYRPLEIAFCTEPGCTIEDIQVTSSADSIVFQDADAASHGLTLIYNIGAETSTGYNANSGPAPSCGVTANGVCYPPPPFDATNTSDSLPQGVIQVRVFEVAAAQFAVTLSCDDLQPMRATMVDCTATPSGAGAETVDFDWLFRPDSIRVFPGQSAPAFAPGSDVPGPSGAGANSWGGLIVTSGWVVVAATTASQPETADSVFLDVQARTGPSWETTESLVGPIQDPVLDGLNHPVSTQGVMREIGLNLDVDGDDDFGWQGSRQDASPISDGGPNNGYFHVQSSLYRWDRSYWLNGHITPNGPVHAVYRGLANHWNGLLAMMPNATPQDLVNGVTAHEAYGNLTGEGHQGRFEQAITGAQCGNINRLMERAVGDGPTFVNIVTAVLRESVDYLDIETEETNVGNNYSGAEHALGTNPNQANGLHVYDNTLNDSRAVFQHSIHSLLCN